MTSGNPLLRCAAALSVLNMKHTRGCQPSASEAERRRGRTRTEWSLWPLAEVNKPHVDQSQMCVCVRTRSLRPKCVWARFDHTFGEGGKGGLMVQGGENSWLYLLVTLELLLFLTTNTSSDGLAQLAQLAHLAQLASAVPTDLE